MAIERRDPLPKGRYWIFLLEGEDPQWQAWVRAHASTVRVRVTERKERLESYTPAIFSTRPDLSIIMEDGGTWVLFDVLAPTPWVGLGFPTIVDNPEIASSSQVEQAPPPEPELKPGDVIRTAAFAVGAIVLAAVALNRVLR